MSSVVHLVPYWSDGDAIKHYATDHNKLIELLTSSYDGLFLNIYSPEIHSPYPIGITLRAFYKMREISHVISRALQAIVSNYFDDPRLCHLMLQLPPEATELLSQMKGRPYFIGSWRPDFLLPEGRGDDILICEINARYAFNGYYCSHEKNKTLHRLPYLDRVPMMPVTELEDIPDLFRGFLTWIKL